MESMERLLWRCLIVLGVFMALVTFLDRTSAATKGPKYKIAVIDTGFNAGLAGGELTKRLCSEGHYDFNFKTPVVGFDVQGHGTYVTQLIDRDINQKSDYCYLIYKVFGLFTNDNRIVANAVKKAVEAGATHINMSLVIFKYHEYDKSILDWATRARKVRVFIAAGNEGRNLNLRCDNYPICSADKNTYLRIIGSYNKYGNRALYSNYGRFVTAFELGEYDGIGRGTSFATPRALGRNIVNLRGE